jgi:predicted dehydrogenase
VALAPDPDQPARDRHARHRRRAVRRVAPLVRGPGRTGEPETVEPIGAVEGADLGYRAASERFVACVREGRDPEVTIRDGLAALEVSLALKRSADSGRTIAYGPAID